MEGFLLGLTNGITCVTSCAPIMIPLFLGEGRRVKQNGWLLMQFLLGRLVGNLFFGVLAWFTGSLILMGGVFSGLMFGIVYLVMGILLLLYGLGEFIRLPRPLSMAMATPEGVSPSSPGHSFLGCSISPRRIYHHFRHFPALFPLVLGLLTGFKLCLPFMAAFTGAASQGSLAASVFFFLAFFVGTTVYFLPLPFVGAFHRVQALRTIGRFAAVFVALYYLYVGVFYLIGGIIS